MMQRNLQLYPQYVSLQAIFCFFDVRPHVIREHPIPGRGRDFTPGGAYSLYNWELFYHAPMFVAGLLSQNQQFQDAMTWYEYILNPTDPNAPAPAGAPAPPPSSPPSPAHFWNFAPLNQMTSTDWSTRTSTTCSRASPPALTSTERPRRSRLGREPVQSRPRRSAPPRRLWQGDRDEVPRQHHCMG